MKLRSRTGRSLAVLTAGVGLAAASLAVASGPAQAASKATGDSMFAWGSNANAEFGIGSSVNSYSPTPAAPQGFSQVAVGSNFACGILSGSAYCWGQNGVGQLGNGVFSNTPSSTPVPVAKATNDLAGKTVVQIVTGDRFACALASNGFAYCWGLGTQGQLGNNAGTTSANPVEVFRGGAIGGASITNISAQANGDFVCATLNTGNVACWGEGSNGQLGDNTATDSNAPVLVSKAAGSSLIGQSVNQIATASLSACAISTSAHVACWGEGSLGELGNAQNTGGTGADSNFPVSVNASTAFFPNSSLAGQTVKSIRGGNSHFCAWTANQTLSCWGSNANGQLGNSSANTTGVPTAVTGGMQFTEFALGAATTCGISGGSAYCWGFAGNGAVGGPAGNSDSNDSFETPQMVNTNGTVSSIWGGNSTYFISAQAKKLGTTVAGPKKLKKRSWATYRTQVANRVSGTATIAIGGNSCVANVVNGWGQCALRAPGKGKFTLTSSFDQGGNLPGTGLGSMKVTVT